MLCCIIGLTLMIPGLALFYGGMVSVKSSTNMMMMTFGACAIVGVLWVLFGFSMTFGTSYGGFVGSITEFAGMKDLLKPNTTISGLPVTLFALFQARFAAITVALISGAVADRMKFGAWMVFAAAWAILVVRASYPFPRPRPALSSLLHVSGIRCQTLVKGGPMVQATFTRQKRELAKVSAWMEKL